MTNEAQNEPLVDQVIQVAIRVVTDGISRIRTCSNARVSCEGWLKVELAHAFVNCVPPVDVIPELDNTDLFLKSGEQEVLVELKTFPTNYGQSGKPITNFIAGVIKDLQKLTQKRTPAQIGLAVWMAYPIPEPKPDQWCTHVHKVKNEAMSTLLDHRVMLSRGWSAHLYIMQCQ